ncbi:MAG: iron-containing alcohol dehydrogenase [Verrucomicrobia bacterium]|nr:iron-containing alcohol dehydrogenase [Verrucomicrobiota bacterium]
MPAFSRVHGPAECQTLPSFEFSTAHRIVFGTGSSSRIPELTQALGDRVLLVTGAHPERLPDTITKGAGEVLRITGEPTFEQIQKALATVHQFKPEVILAAGGGSVLDAGKAMAMLATNPGNPLDYAEVIGAGRGIEHPSLPMIAIPTTAGTGSEVTRNSVLKSETHGVKVSLRHASMLPTVAVIDPTLTLSLPPRATATTGMDALSQCMEPYLSCRANPFTDAYSREGIRRAARSLVRSYRHGDDLAARTDLSLAALCSGIALANAGLGVVHGFAAAIGGRFNAPHGAICATLLPWAMEANWSEAVALGRSDTLNRMQSMARWLTGREAATIADGIAWLHHLRDDLQTPALSKYGITADHADDLAETALRSSSMKGNPFPLSRNRMRDVLLEALAS